MLNPCVKPGAAKRTFCTALATIAMLHASAVTALTQAGKVAGAHDMVGEAFDLDTRELLYREFHVIDESAGLHRVDYRGVDDEVWVAKTLRGSRQLPTPEFSQFDFRTGLLIEALREEQGWLIRRGVLPVDSRAQTPDGELPVAAKDPSGVDEVTLPNTPAMVIDAGFDAFIRTGWDRLQNGEKLQFDFAVPARGRTVSMQVQKVSGDYCREEAVFQGTFTESFPEALGKSCFRLAPASFWVKWLLQPIYLTYSEPGRRLLAYAGMSNIKMQNGKVPNVYIRYRYAPVLSAQ